MSATAELLVYSVIDGCFAEQLQRGGAFSSYINSRFTYLLTYLLTLNIRQTEPRMETSIWQTKSLLVADCERRPRTAAFWPPRSLASAQKRVTWSRIVNSATLCHDADQ